MIDPNKKYKNKKLEAKRKKLLGQQQADALLKEAKKRDVSPYESLLGSLAKVHDDKSVLHARDNLVAGLKPTHSSCFREIIEACKGLEILEDTALVTALRRVAEWHIYWIKKPSEWKCKSYNARRQFSSLVRHLFSKYYVPVFMDEAWLNPQNRYQEWFIDIGGGQNIRKSSGIPVALTKMMAHHFLQAPNECTIVQAFRWGQVKGIGGSERLARAIMASRVGRQFGHDEFWQTVIQFFVNNDGMLDMNQIAPIIDYIQNQKFEEGRIFGAGGYQYVPPVQPNFSMKGRTVQALIAQTEAWHKLLTKVKDHKKTVWESCGINGYEKIEGEGSSCRVFNITELTNTKQLKEEGNAMHHCVYSYAGSCACGRTAIYSMTMTNSSGSERMLTIEVIPQTRTIIQARKKYNAACSALDSRIMHGWATKEGLKFASYY